jgi:uncharacterized protein YqgC (DUF456 family)
METFLIILAGIFVITGFLGSVLPVLPGPPLSFLGLVILHLTNVAQFSSTFFIVWAIIVIVVQLLDALIPIWGTKKFGGSKRGVRGSVIGLFAGLFMGPFGIVIGPFLGALLGELSANKNSKEAIRAAFGAFMGFIVGTVSKLIVAGFMIYYFVEAMIIHYKS